MHGVKRRSAEAEEERRREMAAQVAAFRSITETAMALRAAGDMSEAALDATERVLNYNCDSYTMWNYRREVLEAMFAQIYAAGGATADDDADDDADNGADNGAENGEDAKSPDEQVGALLNRELVLTQRGFKRNPKSYWVWHHRRWATKTHPLCDWETELGLCSHFLDLDKRNFHCWGYRRYVVAATGGAVTPVNEFDYTTKKINQSFSNYSAWHYRSSLFTVIHADDASEKVRAAALDKEYNLAMNAFYTEPADQSAWFYHRWLIGRQTTAVSVADVWWLDGKLVVVFASPVVGVSDETLAVEADGAPVADDGIGWQPVAHAAQTGGFCPVWVRTVGGGSAAPAMVAVRVAAGAAVVDRDGQTYCGDHSFELEASDDGGSLALTTESLASLVTLQFVATATSTEKLEAELAECEELLEMEPDTKWPTLTKAFIMEALERPEADIAALLERLETIDPDRREYYADRRSVVAMAAEARACNVARRDGTLALGSPEPVSLAALGLTCLAHMEQLAWVRVLDLSGNSLKSVVGLELVFALEAVDLSSNRLAWVDELTNPNLATVDLSNNRLERRSAVAGLRALPRLAKLLLRGNPVATLGNGEVAADGDRPWTDVFFPGVEVLSATGE